MAITNAQIIYQQQLALMDSGKIGTTGRTLEAVLDDGSVVQVPEPEQIHTFAAWRQMGYKVRNGEHAIARFHIWKYARGKVFDEMPPEVEAMQHGRCYWKESCFFSASQVEPA